MNQRTSILMRCIALVLALVLVASGANLGAALQVFAANNSEITVTYGQIMAERLNLTEGEVALLESGLLADETYKYVPFSGNAELVKIDTDNHTIAVTEENGYVPVAVYIKDAEGKLAEVLYPVDGVVTYNPAVGDVFSAEVEYDLTVEGTAAKQQALLDAIAYLKNGVETLDAASKVDLTAVVAAMPTLLSLADGDFGGGYIDITLDPKAAGAVYKLDAQMAGDGTLELQEQIAAYADAASKVQFLVENGAAFLKAVNGTYNSLVAIKNDENMLTNPLLDKYLEQTDALNGTNNLTLWVTFRDMLGQAIDTLAAPAAFVAKDAAAMVAENADYQKLDELVAAVGKLSEVTVDDTMLIAKGTVLGTVNMCTVTLESKLYKVVDDVDNDKLELVDTQTAELVLPKGTAGPVIEAALAECDAKFVALWTEQFGYVAEGYVAEKAPAPVALEGDTTVSYTYEPAEVAIEFDGSMEVYPYGYQLTLEPHADVTKAYDYYVGEVPYAQGDVIELTKAVKITRTAGKAYYVTSLYQVIAENFGTAASKAILTSGAISGNQTIRVRMPSAEDADALLTLKDGKLTAVDGYKSDYQGLTWKAYSYGETGSENLFANGNAYTGDEALVKYALSLNVSAAKAQEIAELAVKLQDEAVAQKGALDRLMAYHATMGDLNYATLNIINTLNKGTTYYNDAAKNKEMQEYFTGIITDLMANGTDKDGNLSIYNILTKYNATGLTDYYENCETYINEIADLGKYIGGLVGDAEKERCLGILMGIAGYGEYVEKIKDLQKTLEEVTAALTPTNAAINLEASEAAKATLVSALLGEAKAEAKGPYTAPYVLSGALTVLDESFVNVQVTLNIEGEIFNFNTVPAVRGHVVTEAEVNELIAKFNAQVAAVLGENARYYTVDKDIAPELKALVGKELDANFKTGAVYTVKNYTVIIAGEKNQTVNIDNLIVGLPKHANPAFVYDYTVDGVKLTRGVRSYTFTLEQIDRLFVDGTYTITREEINEGKQMIEDAFGGATKPEDGNKPEGGTGDLEENVTPGNYYEVTYDAEGLAPVSIDAYITSDANGIMSFAMDLLANNFTYQAIDGAPFIYQIPGENGVNEQEISLQAFIDAILNDGEFGSESLIALGHGKNDVLLSTYMDLGTYDADGLTVMYEDVAYNVHLITVPSQLVTVANGLDAVKNYMSFKSVDGIMEVTLNLPDKVYEAYLTALLPTGYTDKTDMNRMNTLIAFEFFYDYVELIANSDATAQSFQNSFDKLVNIADYVTDVNYDVDIAKYEPFYQMVKTALTDGETVVIDRNVEELDVTFTATGKGITNLIDMIGLNLGAYESVLQMVKEFKGEGFITARTVATLTNTLENLDAMIIDVTADGAANKAEYTGNLVERAAKITGPSAIMLLDDIEGTLVLNGETVLDLNGFTINGGLVSNGYTLIVDSTLDSVNNGGVKGDVSGRVRIIAGNYTDNVSDYLFAGYTQNANGAVTNALYTIENANGQLNFTVNSDVLAGFDLSVWSKGHIAEAIPDVNINIADRDVTVDGNVEAVKAYIPYATFAGSLAIDMTTDIVLNYFNAAALYIDGGKMYDFSVYDFIGLFENNKADNFVNAFLGLIDVDAGWSNFANNIVADLLNFGGMSDAIKNGTPMASYDVSIYPWAINLDYIAEGDYVTMGLGSNKDMGSHKTLNLILTGENAKDHLIHRLDEMDRIFDDETKIEMRVYQPVMVNHVLTNVGASADALVSLNFSHNDDYAYVIGVALAYGNPEKADAIAHAINTNDIDALKEEFDSSSVADVFDALKALGIKTSYAEMAKAVGVNVEILEVERVVHFIAVGVGAVLDRLDITGYEGKVMGNLYDSNTGYYVLGTGYHDAYADAYRLGYGVQVEAKIEKLVLKVKIFGGDMYLLGDINLDGTVDHTDVTAAYNIVRMGESFVSTDAHPDYIQLEVGDVNRDGVNDQSDVATLYNYVRGTAELTWEPYYIEIPIQ